MPYVTRNSAGLVIELSSIPIGDSPDWLEASHPDVQRFLQQNKILEQVKSALVNTDLDMVRIIEDLVDLLMIKDVFIFTELPQPVQDKLCSRKRLRKELHSLENLIGDDEGIF